MIAVDLSTDVLAVAAALAGISSVALVQADVLALPLDDGEVDVAHASLLLHHLDPDAGRDGAARDAARRRVAAWWSTTCGAGSCPSR